MAEWIVPIAHPGNYKITTDERGLIVEPWAPLTPSADVPACRDEDSAAPATLAACYPDPSDYDHATHPEGQDGV